MEFIRSKRSLTSSIGLSIIGGIGIAIFYIGVYELSLRGVLASVLAGMVFALPFGILPHFVKWNERLTMFVVTPMSGAIAGIMWWLIANPEGISLLAACVVGCVIFFFGMLLDTGYGFRSNKTAA